MKKWLFLFLINVGIVYSQTDFNDYRPLKSSGTLPEEFSGKRHVSSHTSSVSAETASDQFLQHLLRSGDVLYNDSVGAYLNRIMQVILKANQIDDDVRIYVLKSADANAFAFKKDIILVTLGMLAQVSSEAELAFILCHEFVHYRDKHTEIEYKETVRIETEGKKNKRLTQDEIRYLKSRYSKDLELKADAGGIDLFLQTPYNTEAISTTFDVLRFSDLPFEEEEFSFSFLEGPYFKLNSKYWLADISPVIVDTDKEKEDSKYSSHPDLETRRVDALSRLENVQGGGKNDFVVSRNDFYLYRKIARFEMCRLQLLEHDYINALYSSFLLLKEDANSKYLYRMATRALYGLSSYSSVSKLSKVLPSYKKIAGNSQRLYYLFGEMKKKEITLLALHYGWRAHQLYPDDKDILAVCDELMYQAVSKHEVTPFYFKSELPDTGTTQPVTKDTTTQVTSTDTSSAKKGKYSKIKVVNGNENKTTTVKTSKGVFDYLQYAFIDLVADSSFKSHLKAQYARYEEDEDKKENIPVKNKKSKQIDPERPDINEVVLIEPQKVSVDLRPKATQTLTFANETEKDKLFGTIKKVAGKNGVKQHIVDRYEIGDDEPEELNDFSLMYDFVYEQSTHDDKVTMLPTDFVALQELQNKYGTPYFGVVGVVSFRQPSRAGKVIANVFMPIMYWFALPYGIFRAIQPSYNTYIYSEVYDIETGLRVYYQVEDFKMNATDDIVNPALYNIFKNLSNKK